ncbi:MAG: hypothetical protein LBU41_04300 [Clostridiales Family XIII bacterium]|jgi:hypothetical protein|nr:hypothetical protein [Clostridiales Family XIII bacterium]
MKNQSPGKRAIATFFSVVLLFCFVLSACVQDSPPEMVVKSGSMDIPTSVGLNKWNGGVVDREDNFKVLMKEKTRTDLPYIKVGEIISIELDGTAPDSVILTDSVLNENGGNKYGDVTTEDIQITFKNRKAEFELKTNMASLLSSNSEDYLPGNLIRGFKMTCKWAENECEYAFIIRSDAGFAREKDTI